jgi:hypothetical protein
MREETSVARMVRNYGGAPCSVQGCDRVAEDSFMCGMHAQRVRRYGDPHYKTPEPVRRANNRAAQPHLGQLKHDTYPKLFGRHAHRVIAEQMLGRPLRPGEVVHHRDENRQNYSPENLEVLPSQAEHVRRHFGRAE